MPAWKPISWREGTRQPLRSRFAALRVRPAHHDYKRTLPPAEEWLLIEWLSSQSEPTKYWLSTWPAPAKLRDLVTLAKQRWIIERDYQELKQELGLGHFEGRGWCGFHHHATLCVAAYGFLVAERNRFFPYTRAGHLELSAPNSRRTSIRAGRLRPERHNPYSMTSLRIQLAYYLLRQLSRCPYCGSAAARRL